MGQVSPVLLKLTTLLFIGLFPLYTLANGKVSDLRIESGIIVFEMAETKLHTLPDCTRVESAKEWTLSMQSDGGRAAYSLLLVAMRAGQPVNVESANDCQHISGIERASIITLDLE